ncbi:MAG: type restriction enzyme [Verrucomicrobiota bacterium]|jgi:type III restriction enzyme
MQLKAYQTQTLDQVKLYLRTLTKLRDEVQKLSTSFKVDWADAAWREVRQTNYHARQNGLGEPLPSFCLKIPTGGGKTLLATKAIDLINTHYRKSNRGVVLWIVPTTQIYNQTLSALKDRGHPYRQTLDVASAGRTLILEKGDVFSPADVEENLCVLLLMLASANRKNKEVLRAFKDASGFDAFFPPDGDVSGHTGLLQRFPNLDTFESESGFFKRQVKTSLGNTLRMLRPLTIVDEGQKASRDLARGTVEDFNPCMLMELSATPPALANVLVDIRGQALADEGMVKLDLHIENRTGAHWQDTLLASIEHRQKLEQEARIHEAETGIHIRPICLIQVERTGKNQHGPGLIHADDAKEYLLKHPGITADQIAIKTAQTDELKEVDNVGGLLARDCQIRYIITKQALQEGWDCSFAYVLTILTNPASRNALTQLVGRILRQPYARKTGSQWLDESYVFCFQRRGKELLQEVRKGFGQEGLGDLASRVVTGKQESELGAELTIHVRDRFKKAAQHLVLPAFMIRDGREWRPVHYEPDILARVPWGHVNPSPLYKLPLAEQPDRGIGYRVGLDERIITADPEEAGERLETSEADLDYAFAASHLLDVMPNPWRGNELARKVFSKLLARFDRKIVVQNFVLVLEEMHRELAKQRDHLAREVFEEMLTNGAMRFMVFADSLEPDGFNRLPQTLTLREKEPRAVKENNLQYELSLFEQMPERGFSSRLEQSVATFLEDQAPLYFWHRNRPRADYFVQGWKKNRIYSDFIFTASDPEEKGGASFNRVFVLETKGRHLAGVRDAEDELTDTGYKRDVFTLCTDLSKEKKWSDLVPFMQNKTMRFEVVDEDGWKARLSELLN